MKSTHLALLFAASALIASGQGTLADYERAQALRERYLNAASDLPERAAWIGKTSRFWYRKGVPGGNEFVIFDTSTNTKRPAFDHTRVAAALSEATREEFKPLRLPFNAITFSPDERQFEFAAVGVRWRVDLAGYTVTKLAPPVDGPGPRDRPFASPDGKNEAIIRNYNVYVRAKGAKDAAALSQDGSEGNYYAPPLRWSPDSKRLVAYRIRPGFRRKIHLIESSPLDQLQPKYSSIDYAKPGDVLDLQQPVLFNVAARKQINLDATLFPNPYRLSLPEWRKDSRAFTFEYNQRGHQVYRVLEADAETGRVRPVIEEMSPTFFCYSGKRFREDIGDGQEVVWMSERDGWNHLYLYDGRTGAVKNQITKGQWVVRGVEKVDSEKRQIWFRASGMYPGKDPYFNHYYRINFDGTGLSPVTTEDANHMIAFSPDMSQYVHTWSRLDQAPVSVLRRTADNTVVRELERGNIEELKKAGWRPPEVFTSTGRDGKTDIWGIILRPSNFDPGKRYPVIEYIYAGPQDSFVPKSFSPYFPMQSLAELGFIVVQIDGMGTSNRSKAFHDVCWKNLADAGFPDRILWHKAVAAKYPQYDISRIGIYGHSAGGQNALGALLFHPDFYKAAVSTCGCHDNRMDKIWWNEQWMGWPLGPEYIACSNVENAHRLKGKLLLGVGELDTNVDPASTMQVVNALVKANKTFDLLVLPGMGHTNGGAYGERKRADFFVHHLLAVEPPDWNDK